MFLVVINDTVYYTTLERFHQRCLCIILNIHWSNYVTNIEVLHHVEITSIEAMLLKSQLWWAGHVSRMGSHCLPKIALYSEISTCYCDRGARHQRGILGTPLGEPPGVCHIDHHQWLRLAADCQAWCHAIHRVISAFEDFHRANLREKGCRRKIQRASVAIPNQTFNCDHCG